jgi:pimeloyl-ACP methyl ester carboxylesterase
MVQSRSGKLPGNVSHDGALLRETLIKALTLLQEKELVEESPRLILAGYSFGGIHTLKIADLESKDPRLHVERFIAINPPVSLAYASQVADELALAGSKWSEKQTFDILSETAGRILSARNLEEATLKKGILPTLAPEEEASRFAAGLYFRLPLRSILFEAHRDGMKIPVKTPYKWSSRNSLYLELDKVSFKEYSQRFVAPQFPGKSLDHLMKQGDLRTYTRAARNPAVRVIHTWDDPLLSPEHRLWLDRTYGKRVTWFSRGGHLGNMYMEKVKEKIVGTALK